jgi:hypothetical protein
MLWPYLVVGLSLLLVGVITLRSARVAGAAVILLAALVLGNVREPAAVAACGPTGYTLSGSYSVNTAITVADLPTVTMSDGSRTLSAQWENISVTPSGSTAIFYVNDVSVGSWSLHLVGPASQNLILSSSTPDFVTIGDANNGSPLDIRAASSLVVPRDDALVTVVAQVAQ